MPPSVFLEAGGTTASTPYRNWETMPSRLPWPPTTCSSRTTTQRDKSSKIIPPCADWTHGELAHVGQHTGHIANYRVVPAPKNRLRLWTHRVSCRLALAMAPRWLEIAVPDSPEELITAVVRRGTLLHESWWFVGREGRRRRAACFDSVATPSGSSKNGRRNEPNTGAPHSLSQTTASCIAFGFRGCLIRPPCAHRCTSPRSTCQTTALAPAISHCITA